MVATYRGVRPGDPIADMIFCCVFALFMQELAPRLARYGVKVALPCLASSLFGSVGPPLPRDAALIFAYIDDFAVPIEAECPNRLLDVLLATADVIDLLAAEFGMEVNFSPGKTEALVVLRGQGFAAAQTRLCFDSEHVGHLQRSRGGALRVVLSYRHLGVLTSAGDQGGPEVMQRIAAATAAQHALARTVLSEGHVPFRVRLMVARACILTRLLYADGTWNALPPASLRALAACWASVLRRLVCLHRPPRPGERWTSNAAVRFQCKQPPITRLIAVARLRYYSRVLATGPDYLVALLQSVGGLAWRTLVLTDMASLRTAVSPCLDDLGDPDLHPGAWETFVRSFPRQWTLILKKYLKLPDLDGEALREEPLDVGLWPCGACQRTFPSFAAAGAHRLIVHHQRSTLRLRYAGSVCPHCGVDHRTRHRLLRHLRKGARACVAAAAAETLPLLPGDTVAAEDRADALVRRAAKRAGRHAEHGLPVARPAPLGVARGLAAEVGGPAIALESGGVEPVPRPDVRPPGIRGSRAFGSVGGSRIGGALSPLASCGPGYSAVEPAFFVNTGSAASDWEAGQGPPGQGTTSHVESSGIRWRKRLV